MARKTTKTENEPAAPSLKEEALGHRAKPASSQATAATRKARATALKQTALAAGQPIPKGVALVSFRQPTKAEFAFGKSLGALAQDALKKARQTRA